MTYQNLRKGNPPLEKVLENDPKRADNLAYMKTYLAGKPVSAQRHERHMINYEDFVDELSRSLQSGNFVLLGHSGGYSLHDTPEQTAEREANNIASVAENLHLAISKLTRKRSEKLKLVTDLLPDTSQSALDDYIRGDKDYGQLSEATPEQYKAKLEFARPLLEIARKYNIGITAADLIGKKNETQEQRAKRKAEYIAEKAKKGSLVVTYEGSVRNRSRVAFEIEYNNPSSQVVTVSQNPTLNMLRAAQSFAAPDTPINFVVDTSYMKDRFADYVLIGDVTNAARVEAPVVKTAKGITTCHSAVIVTAKDPVTERAYLDERANRRTLEKELKETKLKQAEKDEVIAGLEEQLQAQLALNSALQADGQPVDRDALEQRLNYIVSAIKEVGKKSGKGIDDKALRGYGHEVVEAANEALYSKRPAAPRTAKFVYHHGEEPLVTLEINLNSAKVAPVPAEPKQ